jgi:hypothetical protein
MTPKMTARGTDPQYISKAIEIIPATTMDRRQIKRRLELNRREGMRLGTRRSGMSIVGSVEGMMDGKDASALRASLYNPSAYEALKLRTPLLYSKLPGAMSHSGLGSMLRYFRSRPRRKGKPAVRDWDLVLAPIYLTFLPGM